MSDISQKLVKRLLEAEGGWINLQHRTLEKIANGCDDPVAEAKELVELYNLYHGTVQVMEIRNTPPSPTDHIAPSQDSSKTGDAPVATPQITSIGPGITESVDGSIGVGTPLTPPQNVVTSPEPLVRQARVERIQRLVAVDKTLGASTGDLNFPSGYIIMDMAAVRITTPTGSYLGAPGVDGQVKGENSRVSGIIRPKGGFRLVFKDYASDEALISCMVKEKL